MASVLYRDAKAGNSALFTSSQVATTGSTVNPGVGAISFIGYAPSIGQSAGIAPASASLAFTGFAPLMGQGTTAAPSPAPLSLYGLVPSIGQGRTIIPDAAAAFIAGLIPLITQGSAAEIKPVSIAQFRLDYPEFADTAKFTDAQIGRQLRAATNMLSESLWAESWPDGIELRTAHFLTIGARNAAAVAGGGSAGAVSGFMTSKQVDKASASYDYGATTYEGAGFWNTTSYGIEFWQLMMLFGAGVIQL